MKSAVGSAQVAVVTLFIKSTLLVLVGILVLRLVLELKAIQFVNWVHKPRPKIK